MAINRSTDIQTEYTDNLKGLHEFMTHEHQQLLMRDLISETMV